MTQQKEDSVELSTRPAVVMLALFALVAGMLLMASLHVLPPTSAISPWRLTLSEYALSPAKWIFDAAVLLVAAGSALAFFELLRRRMLRPLSAGALFGALWTLGLLVIVTFHKTDWSVGPSIGGVIHRYASVVAFTSLPLAVLVAAGPVFHTSKKSRRLARGLGIASLLGFATVGIGVLNMMAGGGPWWLFVPLGLVERLVAGCSVAALALITLGLHPRKTRQL